MIKKPATPLAKPWLYSLVLGLASLLVVLAIKYVMPLPPQILLFSVDSFSSATNNMRTALQYRAVLESLGVQVVFQEMPQRHSSVAWLGSSDAIARVAFTSSLLSDKESRTPLVSLATVDLQPVWIITHLSDVKKLSDLRGKRVAAGPKGGLVRQLSGTMLQQSQISPGAIKWIEAEGLQAGNMLIQREVDALISIDDPEAPLLRLLFANEGLSLVDFPSASAMALRDPRMQSIVMPQGAIELRGNVPSRDLTMLALGHELVVGQDMHPALQRAVLDAASSVHSVAGFLQGGTEFPNYRTAFALSHHARNYAAGDRPWYEHFFPYQWAQGFALFLYVVFPVIALSVLALFWVYRRQRTGIDQLLTHYYGELYFIEDDVFHLETSNSSAWTAVLARIDHLEREVSKVHMPTPFIDRWYDLRLGIASTRLRILRLQQAEPQTI